jgi:hypothetical protein
MTKTLEIQEPPGALKWNKIVLSKNRRLKGWLINTFWYDP